MPTSYENERAEHLRRRTRVFGIDVVVLCDRLPRSVVGYVIAKQLIRAATGVAANYRAACRSRSRNEFISKISLVTEEADESQFWLDVMIAASVLDSPDSRRLLQEATELTAIFTASRKTAKRGRPPLSPILALLAFMALMAMG
jgi:four helix bundle protein